MIELLSLEHTPDGYQMEIGLNRGGESARKILFIDEYTYLQMNVLGPFEQQRVRLSLYSKWDPYRRSYFSTLIKMNRTFSETLYFSCSDDYVSLLHQLKQQEHLPEAQEMAKPAVIPFIEPEPVPQPQPAAKLISPSQQRMKYVFPIKPIIMRCALLCLVLVLFFMRMDGELFTDSVEAHEDQFLAAAVPDDSLPVPNMAAVQNVSLLSVKAEAVPAPSEAPQEEIARYEEFDLNEESYEYGLPKGYVALSFDDGPSQYTKQIVDILREHGVKANFLFIGQNALRYPEEVTYADEQGMPVGNHSWDHSKMTGNSSEENRANLARANRELEKLIKSPVTIFRPPYGAVDDELAAQAGEQHMKVLLWNRDPEDWNADSPKDILHYFNTADPSGGIYLLHEKQLTVEALPEIIQYLKAKGLKFAIFK